MNFIQEIPVRGDAVTEAVDQMVQVVKYDGYRGLRHSICTHFVNAAGGKDGIHAAPVILNEDSDLGEQYVACMELAGRYAYANELRGGDLDESSFAYKRIEQVLVAHSKTIKILHTLTPIGVCMADDRTFDPYK